MLAKQRSPLLAILLVFILINLVYFSGIFGDSREEILRTVSVKVTTVKESTTALGKDVIDNVKSWTLWDPLEWAEEDKGAEPGDVPQDENGIVHDPNEVVQDDGKPVEQAKEEAMEPVEAADGDASPSDDDDASLVAGVGDLPPEVTENVEEDNGSEEPGPESTSTPEAPSESEDEDEDNDAKSKSKTNLPKPSKVSEQEQTEEVGTATEEAEIEETKVPQLTLPELCDKTEWTSGLYLVCHSNCGPNGTAICGGLNNARNRLQTCLRLAIDAGATLVLPRATTRKGNSTGKNDLKHVNYGSEPADYFWDIAGLRRDLARGSRTGRGKWQPPACKQLKLRDWNDWPKADPKDIIGVKWRKWSSTNAYTPGAFRSDVDSTLKSHKIKRSQVSQKRPVILSFGDPFLAWDYNASNERGPIRAGLFNALNFNKEMLSLADKVLDSPQLADGFIGVHLRGERDWPAAFGTMRLQMLLYSRQIQKINRGKKGKTKITTIYVSSGSQEPIEVFRQFVHNRLGKDYKVVDKWTLLEDRPELLEKVENLGFDRKAIVEYKTLLEGRYFLGIVTSTMSNLIAYARTVDEYKDSDSDFFYDVALRGTSKARQVFRILRKSPRMSGSATTRLLIPKAFRDTLERFP